MPMADSLRARSCAHELDEIALRLQAGGLLEIEDERRIDEEMRRLPHQRIERLVEGLVGGARQPQHDGGEGPASNLQRHRGSGNRDSPVLRTQ